MVKISIGRIGKAHGLQGELRVILSDDAFEDILADADFVFVKGLPYGIKQTRQAGGLLLYLEGVTDRSAAEMLKGAELALPDSPDLQAIQSSDPLQEWIGYLIHDVQSGATMGPIEDVIELPTQMTALFTEKGKEILVPLHEDLVQSVDIQAKIIHMNLPEGLLELYQ